MNEAEVVAELNGYLEMLLAGISVFFTVVSAYVAALNYFIGSAQFIARFLSFLFITVILGMLSMLLVGAQFIHSGLIARLDEIREETGLTAAGRAVLANAMARDLFGGRASVDEFVLYAVWASAVLVYLTLAYLTFVHRWSPEVVPISITREGSGKHD